jgi:hypothetical protein
MDLERRSWKAAITGARASIVGSALAACALLWALWTYVHPSDSSPIPPSALATNSGSGAIIIQGTGNTVTATGAEAAPQSGLRRALVGTWKGVTRCATPSGEMVVSGYTRLMDSGQYNYSGDIQFRLPNGSELQFAAGAAGTWTGFGDRFVITASDIKARPRLVRQSGKSDIDLTNPRAVPPQLLPSLEDLMPRGASQEYVILEVTPSTLRAKGTDLRGNRVTYEATRQ